MLVLTSYYGEVRQHLEWGETSWTSCWHALLLSDSARGNKNWWWTVCVCVCVCAHVAYMFRFMCSHHKVPCLFALVTVVSATVRRSCVADGGTSQQTDYGEEMEGPLLLHSWGGIPGMVFPTEPIQKWAAVEKVHARWSLLQGKTWMHG